MFPSSRTSPSQSDSHCLIYYYAVPNLLPACTQCFSSARSSPSQSDSHCLIYYCAVPNLLPACTQCFSSARSSPSQSDSHCLSHQYQHSNRWECAKILVYFRDTYWNTYRETLYPYQRTSIPVRCEAVAIVLSLHARDPAQDEQVLDAFSEDGLC
jgi:hypothetical protein